MMGFEWDVFIFFKKIHYTLSRQAKGVPRFVLKQLYMTATLTNLPAVYYKQQSAFYINYSLEDCRERNKILQR
jgi:hypothetical protein